MRTDNSQAKRDQALGRWERSGAGDLVGTAYLLYDLSDFPITGGFYVEEYPPIKILFCLDLPSEKCKLWFIVKVTILLLLEFMVKDVRVKTKMTN